MTVTPDAHLPDVVAARARAAAAAGRTPCLYVHAAWAPPCRKLKEGLPDAGLASALSGVTALELDITEAEDAHLEPLRRAFGMPYLGGVCPHFVELDAAGRPTGRAMTGGAWGEDTVPNMRRALSAFFQPAAQAMAAASAAPARAAQRPVARA